MAATHADMTQGSIVRHFLRFAIPMAIGLLFQQLYNTVDTFVVGQFVSRQALAAVGNVGSILNMMVGTCAGLATGASVIISQAFGAHDADRLQKSVHTTVCVAFVLCVVATIAGLALIDPMLRLMNMPADVWGDAKRYLTIYFAGISGVMLYNMCSGILRAVGDSRRPLYFLVFSALCNTALDLLLVLRFNMGVAGVAYATVISQALSALLVLLVLTMEQADYGVRWNLLRIDPASLRALFSIGLPSAIQSAVTSFSNVFVQSYINAFGSACMAGWSCYNKLDAFILIPVQSIAMASSTFVGQNFGARQNKRAKAGVSTAFKMCMASTITLSVLMVLCSHPLVSIFSTDQETIDFGVRFINIITPFYCTICFNQIYSGALRGVGDARTPTIIMLCSFVAFRQIYLAITAWLNMGFFAVALAYPMGWILCSTLLTICYRRSIICRQADDQPPVIPGT